MPGVASDTRARILDATAELLRDRGYSGTGLKEISLRASAPFGSLYHFFPGGKVELAAAALRHAAGGYARRAAEALADGGDDPVEAVRFSFDRAADALVATNYTDACPIATVALEVATSNDELRTVTAEIFEGWLATLDAYFVAAGVEAAAARPLSMLFLATLEGGFLLSRAARDPAPLRLLGERMADAVQSALVGPAVTVTHPR
jgi:AcrR family transcriptional regulator